MVFLLFLLFDNYFINIWNENTGGSHCESYDTYLNHLVRRAIIEKMSFLVVMLFSGTNKRKIYHVIAETTSKWLPTTKL